MGHLPHCMPSVVSINNYLKPFKRVPSAQIWAVPATLSELTQAKVRCLLNVVLLTLALTIYYHNPDISIIQIGITAAATALSALFLYAWAYVLESRQLGFRYRFWQRTVSIILDNVAIGWIFHFAGENLAGIYAIYLWITIGYGIRFGLPYLFASLAASVVSFSVATYYTPFWYEHILVTAGLGFGLIIVPLYAAFLINKLHAAVHAAEIAYRAKSDFVAKMSHELRTPLHGIISTTELLKDAKSAPAREELLRIISTSSNTLLELINRVLDISKLDSGSVVLAKETFDLHEVICDAFNVLVPQCRRKHLKHSVFIDPNIPNFVVGSPRQLQEILMNLYGNAVKFTDVGKVSLNATCVSQDSRAVNVRFEVTDNGPGIPSDQIEHIFEPFSQIDNSMTRLHEGSGLGTAIARELVRAMGGDIVIESILGLGSNFSFELSFDRAGAAPGVKPLYPIIVAALGFSEVESELAESFGNFGCRAIFVDSIEELVGVLADIHNIGAVFVNAETNAEYQRDPQRIAQAIPTNTVPKFIVGANEPVSNYANWGYNAGALSWRDTATTVRMLNIACALRKDYSESSPPTRRPSRAPIRILVAEDNPTNQTIVRLTLEREEMEVVIVDNGEAALAELSFGEYDIALLDVHMPKISGLEVAKLHKFAEDPSSRSSVPIILLTADSRSELAIEARATNVTQLLSKPIKPKALVDAIYAATQKTSRADDASGNSEQLADYRPVRSVQPIIDRAILGELEALMTKVERDIFLSEFVEDARRQAATLVLNDDSIDTDKVRDEMHALCSGALSIGALRLANAARRIEFTGKSVLISDCANFRQTLELKINELESTLGLSVASRDKQTQT